MRYQRIEWHHEHDDPVVIFSEIDAAGWERRKVEEYRSGHRDYADADGCSGATRLSDTKIPSIPFIIAQPEFTGGTIEAMVFERVWEIVLRGTDGSG